MFVFAPTIIHRGHSSLFNINPKQWDKYDLNFSQFLNERIDNVTDSGLTPLFIADRESFLLNLNKSIVSNSDSFATISSEVFAEPAGAAPLIADLLLWKASKIKYFEVQEMLDWNFKKCLSLCKSKQTGKLHVYAIKVCLRICLNTKTSKGLDPKSMEIVHNNTHFAKKGETEKDLVSISQKELVDLNAEDFFSLLKEEPETSKEADVKIVKILSKLPEARLREWLLRLKNNNKASSSKGFTPYLTDSEIEEFANKWFGLDLKFTDQETETMTSTIDFQTFLVFLRQLYMNVLRDYKVTQAMMYKRTIQWWPSHLENPKEYLFTGSFNRFSKESVPEEHMPLFRK